MIAVYCDEMNSRVVVGLDSITSMDSGGGVVDVAYRCVCGRAGQLLTGRDRRSGERSGHVV